MHVVLFLLGPLTLFLPALAHAQVGALQGIVNTITSGTPLASSAFSSGIVCGNVVGAGACQVAALLVFFVQRIRVIVGALAFLIIVIAGFRLVISQSEEALGTARRTIVGAIAGLFLIFTAEPFVEALYGGFGNAPGTRLSSSSSAIIGAQVLSGEIFGILRWGETLVAIVAVTLLIVQAFAVLASMGSEETIRKSYRAALYTIVGLLLLVFDRTIAAVFGYDTIGDYPGPPNAGIFIVELFGFVRFALMFVGMLAVAIIVYAGLLMLFNYGNDEILSRGKKILGHTALGLVMIAVAFVIVSTIILGVT